MAAITTIRGRAVPVTGDDIDTDRIIPARYLKEITFAKMGDYPFFDERFAADGSKKEHPFNRTEYQGASILIANSNFGCGSSREHAPQALFRWGIKAVVAESYGEIFAGNSTMLGLPTVLASSDDVARLQKIATDHPETEISVDLVGMKVTAGKIEVKITMPEGRRKALVDGIWDSTTLLLANREKIKATAAKLPYMAGFSRG
ncbi:MAG TPA: 3-isopropylmalate dehydratase small subunit [Spirochaetia bacterium]|nr:3-isopropylmalate dehydratase small subunit [Spirochaetia bacterium]